LLDGFDLNLEGADNGQPGPLMPEAADLLKALLHYLHFAGKMTHLVIAGRYDFSLTQQGRNLVDERLKKVWLTGFQEPEQRKKARELEHIFNHHDNMLMAEVILASHGNPRLMEWMDMVVGQMPAAEEPELMEAVKKKQEEFIETHLIRQVLQQSGDPLAHFLSCLSIYRRPVLKEGVKLAAEKAGLGNGDELLKRAMGLGLIEHDEAHTNYRVTPLLRDRLFESIKDIQRCDEAAFEYYQKACDIPGQPDPGLVEELVFHSSRCGQEEEVSRRGAWLVEHYRKSLDIPESRRVEQWVSEELRSLKERKKQ
jgi:hypothetical protein